MVFYEPRMPELIMNGNINDLVTVSRQSRKNSNSPSITGMDTGVDIFTGYSIRFGCMGSYLRLDPSGDTSEFQKYGDYRSVVQNYLSYSGEIQKWLKRHKSDRDSLDSKMSLTIIV